MSASELLDLAMAAASEAGRTLAGGRAAPHSVDIKSSPGDVVSELDRASERLIVETLLAARPDDGILGEEGGERAGSSGIRWVIDPLDGTLNFLRGTSAFAVSIAAEIEGESVAGVVYEPATSRTYAAVRGHGAWCDGRPITASRQKRLSHALVGTGFGHDLALRAQQASLLGDVAKRVMDIRSSGSAALDLCAVAAGHLDVYYECDTRLWDRAAGTLIAAEAGAAISGRVPGRPGDELVIAGSAPLVDAIRDLCAERLRPDPAGGW
ncbi:myo-inositol-1(or 4)-monophosphatase [Micromonospora eburnea]|uniref:Inositol-1-monophosphatase n=2 Tax=Micromonospora eburnea TaxID=227316 RepID=A0A1C6V173_9ACTN|nr:myo-inositol-1(or 4)-monophosphatase [Micromonospora eburnea]